MIHRQGRYLAAQASRPAVGEQAQGPTVTASRDGDSQAGPRLERTDGPHQTGELDLGKERREFGVSANVHWQLLRRRWRTASSLMWLCASGKTLSNSANVKQAASRFSELASDMASLSKLSAALAPSLYFL